MKLFKIPKNYTKFWFLKLLGIAGGTEIINIDNELLPEQPRIYICRNRIHICLDCPTSRLFYFSSLQ